MSNQLALPFTRFDRFDFDMFLPGNNNHVIENLKQIASGTRPGNLYLWGDEGCGKSHLLQATCTLAASQQRQVIYVPLKEKSLLAPDLLHGMESLELVCLDDIGEIGTDDDWQLAVFNLFNRLQEAGKSLLVTANTSPRGVAITLPDLKSRLSAAVIYHVAGLQESGRLQALQQRATSRGMEMPDDVIDFLSKRISRDMHSLFDWLDRIDDASLVEQKKLTVPFLRNLLSRQQRR